MAYRVLLILFAIYSIVDSDALGQASLEYQETLVIFGKGRRTERDLSECTDMYEACNLAHHRLWLAPITERLCRCPRRAQCPLSFKGTNDTTSQHITNRAQLKFCEPLDDGFPKCINGQESLHVEHPKQFETHTRLQCKCIWPYQLIYNSTQDNTQIYTCNELPPAESTKSCGYIRPDTYEVYYTSSCPENHLCVFKNLVNMVKIDNFAHYDALTLPAFCVHE